jgi:hypothetical protein
LVCFVGHNEQLAGSDRASEIIHQNASDTIKSKRQLMSDVSITRLKH